MKLLIVTQKVDYNDPILGFFHRWIVEFAKHCESIVVICLEKGTSELPSHVKVLSLGKEDGVSRMKYIVRFYRYIWHKRREYDAVFVHMNQEYILLGGFLWRMLSKKIYLWRNHHAGSFLTDVAASFCAKVFCTSKYSYTAKYPHTVFMPVGVDLTCFKPQQNIERKNNALLFLARFSPTKRPDLFVDVLKKIDDNNIAYTASIYGDPAKSDEKYYESIKARVLTYGLGQRIIFHKGVPHNETPKIYSSHGIFVNLSSSGMYDKTIFEAMACGCLVIASNDNLRGLIDDDFIFKQADVVELSSKLIKVLKYTANERARASSQLQNFSKAHSLEALALKLISCISR